MSHLKLVQNSVINKAEGKIPSVIAVAAGKGGVGKSTVAVNLALALKAQGHRVGLLDADIYGPSLVQMLPDGLEPIEDPEKPERLLPAQAFGIPFISVAHFRKEAAIVRAPIANQIIEQFLTIVDWGDLEYLIVDFPPGTGDIQLTLMQKGSFTSAIVVTTPQKVATLDVRKAMQLFEQMSIPIAGVVENMSYLHVGREKVFPFGQGGGSELAKEFSVPLLAQIPIDPLISEMGDSGNSLLEAKGSDLAGKMMQLAQRVKEREKTIQLPEISVRQVASDQLEFLIDGVWQSISASMIQNQCPCASCHGKKKEEKEVSILEFSPVGRYAIRLQFSIGCSRGIYPYSQLIKLCL